MNSKTTDNIKNAVLVLLKTYENINKFLNACKNISKDGDSNYKLLTENFLRRKSDRDFRFWLIHEFALIYKRNDDDLNAIFGMVINLDEACVYLAKYVYNTEIDFTRYFSPAEIWRYSNPLLDIETGDFSSKIEDGLSRVIPNPENNYLDLDCVLFKRISLVEIDEINVKEKVFGTFEELSKTE